MKKLTLLLVSTLLSVTFISCSNTENKSISKNKTTDNPELIYEALSTKEDYISTLSGNKILMYSLNNIPQNQKYKLSLTYEVYKNKDKVKEEEITTLMQDDSTAKNENHSIGINFQKNKIRYLLGLSGGYSSGEHDIDEDLSGYTQSYLTNNVPFNLGTETYIYYATSKNSMRSDAPLGSQINSDTLNELLKDSESTMLVKLSFKEI